MAYENVVVRMNNSAIATKKGLKALVDEKSPNLTFHPTSPFGDTSVKTIADLDKGMKYSVVGPTEYKRTWFATVSFNDKLQKWCVSA